MRLQSRSTLACRRIGTAGLVLVCVTGALSGTAQARNMNPGDEIGGCAADIRCAGGDNSPSGTGWGVNSPVAGPVFDPGTGPGQIGPPSGPGGGIGGGTGGGGGGSIGSLGQQALANLQWTCDRVLVSLVTGRTDCQAVNANASAIIATCNDPGQYGQPPCTDAHWWNR